MTFNYGSAPNTAIQYLEAVEVRRVIDAVPKISLHPERDQLLIEIMWRTGARIGEILALKPEDIGLAEIHFITEKQNRKGSKNADKLPPTRDVVVTEKFCDRIKEYCKKNEIEVGMWVFPQVRSNVKHLDRQEVGKMCTKASEEAQILRFGVRNVRTGGRYKGVSPKVFRHSHATYLLDQEMPLLDIQERLGHANISSTAVYTHVKKARVRKKINQMKWD